jgi:topoisomerase-4 subunit A
VHDTEEESAGNAVVVHLRPALRLRNVSRPFVFGEITVKSRGSRGNIVTKLPVDRVVRASSSDLGGS